MTYARFLRYWRLCVCVCVWGGGGGGGGGGMDPLALSGQTVMTLRKKIKTFHQELAFEMLSAKYQPFCPGPNVSK